MKLIAIITTHPIQYNAPLFALLNQRKKVRVKVFYTWGQKVLSNKFDPGFGSQIEWDIPLLEGYDFTFIKNTSTDPGTHHFKGIINPTLNSEIMAFKPDAILLFGWNFHSHLKCLRYFHKKIPIIFRGDSTLLDKMGFIRKVLRRFFLKWIYSHVNFALYVGKNNKKYFIAHGLKATQLFYAPHAIDNNRFAEPEDAYKMKALALRKNIGLKPDDVVVLFAGKLEAKKNPFLLISLLKIIKDEKLKILFVGSGKLSNSIKLATDNDARIVFLGFQNQQQMPIIYRVADLFILPSKGPGETWGLALNEAMASGKAVVASNKTGGAIDLIDEGINGLTIDLQNHNSLNQLIQRSLNDKKILIEMGRQSSLKIKSFSYDRIVTALEDIVMHL